VLQVKKIGFMWHKYEPMKIGLIHPEGNYHFAFNARISPSNFQNFLFSTSSDMVYTFPGMFMVFESLTGLLTN
jgi:hypothetical protein